jgi:hypothetical protein
VRLFRPRPRVAEPPIRLADRTLFIIGAARSGTTVLQNALNDSPDIFLLGEPDIYGDTDPGFAGRYNAMHRSWGNQQTKSSHLPALNETDGAWREHLAALARHHRWVGAKLVINPVRAEGELDRRFDLHTREFYSSRYLFTFRDPLAAALSTRDLQLLLGGDTNGLDVILKNQMEVIAFYVRALRLLPHVRAVFHEDVAPSTFEALSAWLGTPLDRAFSYYDQSRVRTYVVDQVEDGRRELLVQIRDVYAALRTAAAAGFTTPQLEQNDNHLSPTHYTALGSIDRRARFLADCLA